MSADAPPTPGQAAKSRVSLEPSEIDEAADVVTEVMISIERKDEPDEDMRHQVLLMTPAEFEALRKRIRLHGEQGIWSTGTVER